MADGPSNGLWATIQPWVQGLIAPGLFGAGVSIKWLVARLQEKSDGERAAREEADDFRLKDRAQISLESAAAFKRLSEENAALRSENARIDASAQRAWDAFEATLERWREMRHDLNGIIAQLYLDWQIGKKAPIVPPTLPPVPTKQDILNLMGKP